MSDSYPASADAGSVKARYYPPTGQSAALSATLSAGAEPGIVMLSVSGHEPLRRLGIDEIQVSERFSRATRTVQLADGSVLEIDDGAQLSRLLAGAGRPDAIVTRWQHSWRMVAVSLVLSVVTAVAGYVWLLPVVADHLASRVPSSWAQALDSMVLGQMERLESLKATELTAEQQQRLRARFDAIAASKPGMPQVTVYFHKMGDMPNAFALPGGSIVFLDGIVKIAPDDDALVGVFAHELGHVEHRHGLRTLLRTAAVSAVAAWYFGDFTSLANAAVIASQLSYSRDFETQADDTAIDLMRTHRLNTGSLAELFRRMRDRSGAHDHSPNGETDVKKDNSEREATPPKSESAAKPSRKQRGPFALPEFLSTHPDIERRIERFEKASTR